MRPGNPGYVFGSEQFMQEWTPPEHVEYVDLVSYDGDGNARTLTKLYLKNPPPSPAPSPAEEWTLHQKVVDFVEHESGVTRVVFIPRGKE